MDTKIKRHLGFLLGVLFVISACAGQTPSTRRAPQCGAEQPKPSASASAPAVRLADRARGRPGRGGHQGHRAGAVISVWTFWLSPTFDK